MNADGFELQVLALELSDAYADLNDAYSKAEGRLRNRRCRPVWVSMEKGAALIWTGQQLHYDSGISREYKSVPLASVSQEIRIEAVRYLDALEAELMRSR